MLSRKKLRTQRQRVETWDRLRDAIGRHETRVLDDRYEWLCPHAAPADDPGRFCVDSHYSVVALIDRAGNHVARCIGAIALCATLRPRYHTVFANHKAYRQLLDQVFPGRAIDILHGDVEWPAVFALQTELDQWMRSLAPHPGYGGYRYRDPQRRDWQVAAGRHALAQIALQAVALLATGNPSCLTTAANHLHTASATNGTGGQDDTVARWFDRYASMLPLANLEEVRLGDLTPVLIRGLQHESVDIALGAAGVLLRAPDPAAGPALMAATTRYRRIAETALDALSAAGPSALPDWQPVADLTDADGTPNEVRVRAARLLATVGHERAVPVLAKMAARGNQFHLRQAAVHSLVELDAPESRVALRALVDDPSPALAVPCAAALARVGDEAGMPAVERWIHRSSSPWHSQLFAVLDERWTVGHIPQLLDLLGVHGHALHPLLEKMPRDHLVTAITDRLLTAGQKRPKPLLDLLRAIDEVRWVRARLARRLLNDGLDVDERIAAAWALGHIGTTAAQRDLDAATRVPERRLRKAAIRVQRHLSLTSGSHRRHRQRSRDHRQVVRQAARH